MCGLPEKRKKKERAMTENISWNVHKFSFKYNFILLTARNDFYTLKNVF